MGFVCIVCDIELHDDVSSRNFADEIPDKHPHEWMKQALITLEEATKAYKVEVIAKSHH